MEKTNNTSNSFSDDNQAFRLIEIDEKTRMQYAEKDARHWATLETLILQSGLGMRDVLKHYLAFIRRRDLSRLLAHYELFKHIEEMPGSIVELGVFLGDGLFTWANLLETFCPGDRSRRVYGFEHFAGYKIDSLGSKEQDWVKNLTTNFGSFKVSRNLVEGLLDLHNQDSFLPGVDRCKIIAGNIEETVPSFINSCGGLRLCMLYVDVNLYEPTFIGLKNFYELVIPGGIIAFNGYGLPYWDGESRAIDGFFKGIGRNPEWKKFPFSIIPGAYFFK